MQHAGQRTYRVGERGRWLSLWVSACMWLSLAFWILSEKINSGEVRPFRSGPVDMLAGQIFRPYSIFLAHSSVRPRLDSPSGEVKGVNKAPNPKRHQIPHISSSGGAFLAPAPDVHAPPPPERMASATGR